jgi:cytochrome P450
MTMLEQLPMLNTMSPEYQADWHGLNRAALAESPVAQGTFGPVLLGYREVQTVIRDRSFRNPPALALEVQGITDGELYDRTISGILSLDGDEHTRLRRLVAQAFRPQAADRLRTVMGRVMTELLDSVDDQDQLDVVRLVESYPIAVICEVLGFPREDWPLFSRLTDDLFKIFNFNLVNDGPIVLDAMHAIDEYVDGVVEERRAGGVAHDDLFGDLMRAEDDGDRLSHSELQMLVSATLTAGTDTTRNQLAAAIEVFCQHPDQWALLREQPDLVTGAVDEVMRFEPIITGLLRTATADREIAGLPIAAGSLVELSSSAANRDPSVFHDPDRFDITRHDAEPQLTFGGGIHYCLGVHLAKAELAEGLTLMSQRWPQIEQAGEAPWKPIVGVSGPTTLPISIAR